MFDEHLKFVICFACEDEDALLHYHTTALIEENETGVAAHQRKD
jgi:hypothetical protein